MVFLANPCVCGSAYKELDEKTKECAKCNRRMELQPGGYWKQVRPKDEVGKL